MRTMMLLVLVLFVSLMPVVAFAGGSVLNPEEIGGVGVLHVTPIDGSTSDPFFPTEIVGYHVVLDGLAINSDSVEVNFDAVLTDSTCYRENGHDDIWTSVKFRDDCLVTVNATWERDGHRLVALNVGLLSIFSRRR